MNIKRLEAVAEAALPGPLEGFAKKQTRRLAQKAGLATDPPVDPGELGAGAEINSARQTRRL